MVEANGARLTTVALRPVHMYGPYDVLLLAAMDKRGLRYPLKLQSVWATRPPQFSIISRRNCAHAHVLAAQTLAAGADRARHLGGRALMVHEGASFNCVEYMQRAARARGVADAVTSLWIEPLLVLAWFTDLIVILLYRLGLIRPFFLTFTRSALLSAGVDNVARDTTFADVTGFRPIVTTEAALAEVMQWARTHAW